MGFRATDLAHTSSCRETQVVDEDREISARCVWSEPCPINLICVDVTVTHPRPDFRLGGTMHADGRFSPSPTRVIAADSDGT